MPDSPATAKEIRVLQLVGVEARTEEVYRAMLALPSADIPELADTLGLSPGVVTEELDRLAELMLVVSGSAPGLSYLAVPPIRRSKSSSPARRRGCASCSSRWSAAAET